MGKACRSWIEFIYPSSECAYPDKAWIINEYLDYEILTKTEQITLLILKMLVLAWRRIKNVDPIAIRSNPDFPLMIYRDRADGILA